MGGRDRMIATLIIWVAFTVMMTSSSGPAARADGTAITGILAGAAFLSTLAVWFGSFRQAQTTESQITAAEKGKRRSGTRVSRLMDEMDADDLAELRARLMALDDEGEQVSLETLLTEEESQRSYR